MPFYFQRNEGQESLKPANDILSTHTALQKADGDLATVRRAFEEARADCQQLVGAMEAGQKLERGRAAFGISNGVTGLPPVSDVFHLFAIIFLCP